LNEKADRTLLHSSLIGSPDIFYLIVLFYERSRKRGLG